MAATAMASSPSRKSTPITTRSPSPTAKRCCATRHMTTTSTNTSTPAEVSSEHDDAEGDEEHSHIEQAPTSNEPVESVGGSDALDDAQERRRPSQRRHQYKIQEVIKRRQVMLVQVVKEERGNKGA